MNKRQTGAFTPARAARLAVIGALLFHGALWAQCQKDTDCKGDRICVKGECVEQQTAPPAPQAQTTPPAQPQATAAPQGQAKPNAAPTAVPQDAAKTIASLIEAAKLDSATRLCDELLSKDSTSVTALGGLAAVAFVRTNWDECVSFVKKAIAAAGSESLEMAYYLGSSLGRLGNNEEAVGHLGKWAALPGDEGLKRKMKDEQAFYENRIFETMAKSAVAGENTSGSVSLNDSLVAVIPFINAGGDARFGALKTGLADMIITDLSQVTSLRLVERVRMQKLLGEMSLDQAGVTKDSDRGRVAKFLRASRLIGGMYKCPDTSSIKLKGGFIDAATQKTVSVDALDANLKDFFGLEKKFVFSVVDKMGIKLSDAEREKIRKVPTENLLAYLAYGEGLEASDKGNFDAAKQSFEKAARLDPKFDAAADKAHAMGAAQSLSKPATPVQESVVPAEPPVVFLTSGPTVLLSPVVRNSQPPARVSLRAGSDFSVRAATLAQAGFMPEVPVPQTQPQASSGQPSGGQQGNQQGQQGSNNTLENSSIYSRPSYADAENMGLGNKTQVNIIIELPEAR